eukprot:scaffold302914_cov46-Prasinocladus_malaysianus.AAC.1
MSSRSSQLPVDISESTGEFLSTSVSVNRRKTHPSGYIVCKERIFDGNYVNEVDAAAVREFFCLLSVCHTVLPEEREVNGKTVIQYQASA